MGVLDGQHVLVTGGASGIGKACAARYRAEGATVYVADLHPRSSDEIQLDVSDSAAWATYNPTGVTPLFVVVDQSGVIRFRAMGASAMDAVTAKVKELLVPAPQH